jgi:hypothetical protein
MAPIVIHHAPAQTDVGGFLLGLDQRRVYLEAARVGVIGETLDGDLPCHLGGMLGMDGVIGQLALDHQRLLLRHLILLGVDVAEIVHPAQYI